MSSICDYIQNFQSDSLLLKELKAFFKKRNEMVIFDISRLLNCVLEKLPEYVIGVEQDLVQFYLDLFSLIQRELNSSTFNTNQIFNYDPNLTKKRSSEISHSIFKQNCDDCLTKYHSGQIAMEKVCKCGKEYKFDSFYSLLVKYFIINS